MKIFLSFSLLWLITLNVGANEGVPILDSDWFQKIRPFIIPLLIIVFLIFRNDDKDKKVKDNKNESLDEQEQEYQDEWNYENQTNEQKAQENLQIKVEEKTISETPSYVVLANGLLNFTNEQIEKTKAENEEAKFTCYVFDITDVENQVPLNCTNNTYNDEYNLLCQSRNMKVGLNFAYNDWTPMFIFPKSIIIPPYRGQRKFKFLVTSSNLNAKFEQATINNKDDFYFDLSTDFEIEFNEPGYLEQKGFEEDVNEKIVQLGMAITYSEKENNQQGIDALKSWVNQEILLKNFYFEDEDEELDKKLKYSYLMRNTYELLKANKLSMSEIVKEINYKTNIAKRYEVMNLLLNIAGSDDRLSSAEDKLLNKTARALELDIDKFQQMKTSTIANIETIDENSEDSEETIFNFTSDMSDEEKCKRLRQEYTRWNRQTNNSNEKIRNQARKMVELTANLRKKYNC